MTLRHRKGRLQYASDRTRRISQLVLDSAAVQTARKYAIVPIQLTIRRACPFSSMSDATLPKLIRSPGARTKTSFPIFLRRIEQNSPPSSTARSYQPPINREKDQGVTACVAIEIVRATALRESTEGLPGACVGAFVSMGTVGIIERANPSRTRGHRFGKIGTVRAPWDFGGGGGGIWPAIQHHEPPFKGAVPSAVRHSRHSAAPCWATGTAQDPIDPGSCDRSTPWGNAANRASLLEGKNCARTRACVSACMYTCISLISRSIFRDGSD